MNAARTTIRCAWTALGLFLRGFLGAALEKSGCEHDDHHAHGGATPASVRAALTAEASRRGRCC